MPIENSQLRRFSGPSYLIAALLIAIPLVDLFSNMIPVRVGDPAWRYGAVGLGSGFMLTPMLGVLLAVWLSVTLGQTGVIRALGWVNLSLGLLLIPLLVLFVLDAIQVRIAVQPDSVRQFDIGVVKAVIKLLSGAGVFAWLGLRAVRVRKGSRRSDPQPELRRSPAAR